LVPASLLLDLVLSPVFSGNGRKGPSARSTKYLVFLFYGRSRENLEGAIQEGAKITSGGKGMKLKAMSCGSSRCWEKP